MTAQLTQRQSRFLAGLPAEVRSGTRTFDCVAHDLSRSGTLLAGELPDDPEDAVELTLRSAAGDLRLTLTARVVRAGTLPGHDGVRWGVEFPPLDPPRYAILDALVARVVEGIFPAVLAALDTNADAAEILGALKLVPLAHRVALAQRAGPREREMLFHDGHPAVLEALARNPGASPPELRRLLRRHDLAPATIDFLTRDKRTSHDMDLRLALLIHPQTSMDTVDLLLRELGPRERERALASPGLRQAVAERLLRASKPPLGRRG